MKNISKKGVGNSLNRLDYIYIWPEGVSNYSHLTAIGEITTLDAGETNTLNDGNFEVTKDKVYYIRVKSYAKEYAGVEYELMVEFKND